MSDDDLLDGRFIDTIKPLDMKSGSSGLLPVNWKDWCQWVINSERRMQLGCLGFVVVGIGYSILGLFDDYTKFPVFLACFFLGVLYTIFHVRMHRNLKEHGRYRYEVFPNKVVRFSDRDFRVMEFKDVTKVSLKYYGLLLERKPRWGNDWLKQGNPEIMVLPRSLTSYSAVAEYVRAQVEDERAS